MKFLRWLLGSILVMLTFLAWQEGRSVQPMQVVEPKLERSALEGRDFVYYTIQAGDTLEGLTRKFRIPAPQAILEINQGLKQDKLPVNQQIKIPLR